MSGTNDKGLNHRLNLRPTVVEDGIPVRWVRLVEVEYTVAGPAWRPALEGEKCRAGGGGRGASRTLSCGKPAVVVQVQHRKGKMWEFDYRWGLCGGHAGGLLPLPDGRVAEPVENPLGGAS